MLLMLPGIVMISLYLILTRNFTSRNRQQVTWSPAVAALAINVGCNWFLIPASVFSGAAVSTAISYSVAALILLVMFVRSRGTRDGDAVRRPGGLRERWSGWRPGCAGRPWNDLENDGGLRPEGVG